jgi:SAM-dependent methyltransferase
VSAQYGASFADVYDEWYAEPSGATTAEAVATLADLANGGPVLELGVGTGRLALPLAAQGLTVHGVDASSAMLAALRAKPGSDALHLVDGDMARDLPSGPFALVFIAINTLFNLTTESEQQTCFANVAARLAPNGRFVIEAFVPAAGADTSRVEVRTLTADRVVLVASSTRGQHVDGQHIELVDGQPVRLRPWSIRWATIEQLDTMATAVGLSVEARWASWRRDRFTDDSAAHVTVYKSSEHAK